MKFRVCLEAIIITFRCRSRITAFGFLYDNNEMFKDMSVFSINLFCIIVTCPRCQEVGDYCISKRHTCALLFICTMQPRLKCILCFRQIYRRPCQCLIRICWGHQLADKPCCLGCLEIFVKCMFIGSMTSSR